MGGGGGGDSGAAKREERRRLEEEARAKAAVDRVNSLFGIGGDASMMVAPDVNDYTRTVWTNGTTSPEATAAAARELMAGGSSFNNGYSQSVPGATIRNGVTYYDQPVTLQPYEKRTRQRVGGRNGHWENSVKTVTPPGLYQTSLVDDAFNQANFAYQRGAALRARNQLYDTVSNDTFNFHRQRLDDDRDQAERSLRFQLARQGQFGGSLDVDQNSELSKGYNNGLVDARNMADAAPPDATVDADLPDSNAYCTLGNEHGEWLFVANRMSGDCVDNVIQYVYFDIFIQQQLDCDAPMLTYANYDCNLDDTVKCSTPYGDETVTFHFRQVARDVIGGTMEAAIGGGVGSPPSMCSFSLSMTRVN